MKNIPRLLALAAFLGAVACRSSGNTPVDTDTGVDPMDAGVTDTPVTPTDTPVSTMDNGTTDARPPRDIGPCDRTGPENSASACADGMDNDCDGFTDCADFDCPSSVCPREGGMSDAPMRLDTTGCVRMGSESSATTCSDGIDNDCDGFADCNDRNCSCIGTCGPSSFGARGCMCDGHAAEGSSPAQCSDMRDNDCNGYTDTMDFGCQARDGGTATDAPMRLDTAGCMPTGPETSATLCGDGIDNDCNGFADCNDFSCSCQGSCGPSTRAPTCTCMGSENTNTTCGDRIDNDCDGFTDCADFSCSMTPAVTICPSDAGTPRG